MVVRPAKRAKESLKALLAAIDSSNLSIAPFEDMPKGKEIW